MIFWGAFAELVIQINPSSCDEIKFGKSIILIIVNVAEMAKRKKNSEKVAALVCQHFTCTSPVF